MRKLLLSLGLMIVAVPFIFAQNSKPVQQKNLWKAGLLAPNIEYEAKLDKNLTLRSEVGLSFEFGYGGNQIGWLFDYGLYAEISSRYYYNFDNRLEDGKTIRYYSANYVSFLLRPYLSNVMSSTENPNQYVFGPTWGLQRYLGKDWYLNFELGPGISVNRQETLFVPLLGFDIGVLL